MKIENIDNSVSMSPHTFLWGSKVSSDTYSTLFKLLIKTRITYVTDSYIKYTTYDYSPLGINRIEFMDYKHQYYQHLYYISFLINPYILTGQSTQLYTRIVEKAQLKTLPDTVTSILSKLCGFIEDIANNGKYRRIDYCCNLWFNSQETAEVYLYLLKQAKIPQSFELKKYSNPKQKRKTTEPYAITIACKSYELSIYLKYPQLRAKYDSGDLNDPDELANACGQLRIELRERRPKLLADKKKYSLSEPELLNGSNPRPIETLCRIFNTMYGFGDFLLYEDAKEKILNSNYHVKVKKRMLNILETVKKGRGLDPEKNRLALNIITKTMPYFNKLDISPITISQKKYEYCGIETFPNPLKYITGKTLSLLDDTDVLETTSYNEK